MTTNITLADLDSNIGLASLLTAVESTGALDPTQAMVTDSVLASCFQDSSIDSERVEPRAEKLRQRLKTEFDPTWGAFKCPHCTESDPVISVETTSDLAMTFDNGSGVLNVICENCEDAFKLDIAVTNVRA